MLISVIVPVYNAERWLERCAASILGQTHADLELILVDDGSMDGSPAICDALAASDARVRVIHKVNAGVSAARNDGIEASRGEWIAFCDNDDFMAPGMLARLLEIALAADADISQCRPVRGTAESLVNPLHEPVDVFTGRQMLESFYTRGSLYVWDKLYRRSVWAAVRFPVGSYMHEDNAIIHRLYGSAACVAVTAETLYYHYRNPQSVVGSGFNLRWGHDDPYADRIAYARAEGLPRLLADTLHRRVYHERYLLSMNRRYTRSREFAAHHDALLRRYYRDALAVPGISLRNSAFMFSCRFVPLVYHTYNFLKWRLLRPNIPVRFGEIK